jgi:hypothetical protein
MEYCPPSAVSCFPFSASSDGLLPPYNTTEQDVPLQPGLNRLTAEFVAADHVPFNPWVRTTIVIDVR